MNKTDKKNLTGLDLLFAGERKTKCIEVLMIGVIDVDPGRIVSAGAELSAAGHRLGTGRIEIH